ncbi:MAG TPA: PKD domain-containing protein [Pseudomonadales bacterium]|nr:PKD domain-containing protein [Pseudomonadales bacterium]
MTKLLSLDRLSLKLATLALVLLPGLAGAQNFTYNPYGDVLSGFRKTGANAGSYELVVNLGNITNFLNLSAGTTINITNFTASTLTDAFTNYNNLQWSDFAGIPSSGTRNPPPWVSGLGAFPANTIWYTVPRTNVNNQTQPPSGSTQAAQATPRSLMNSVGVGAGTISGFLNITNADNNSILVREPVTYSSSILSAFISDPQSTTNGDFGGSLSTSVEGWTPASFTSAERNDLYQVCPLGYTNPVTTVTNGPGYFVGYFTLNPSGTMTFTRASAVTPPAAGSITASATNGFNPLTVIFTNSATGSITNWVWNFGNGTTITNTTGGNVTNTYATTGNFTVTLTVYGPGGSSTVNVANFIMTVPTPKISLTAGNGQIVLTGTNCPAGVQYRFLTSTNVLTPLISWKPIYTNTFGSNGTFAYTNTVGPTNSFFILVSP